MKERIVDVIWKASPSRGRGSKLSVGIAFALFLHGAVVTLAAQSEPTLESWVSQIALEVHDDLSREDIVTLEPDKVPLPEPEDKAMPLAKPTHTSRALSTVKEAVKEVAPSAVTAGKVITAEPSDAPADFSDNTFVTGEGKAYVGGTTSKTGQTETPIQQKEVGKAVSSSARAVAMAQHDWTCAWPKTAEGELLDEQIVVIRVLVATDGSVMNASIIRDARGGFGEAALACARKTRFAAALDNAGAPISSWSPPIEVRFTRQ